MNDFEITTVINRPVEEVWAYMDDPQNLPTYNQAVREFRLTSEGPVGIGSTSVITASFLGRRFETGWEMTDYKTNELAATRAISGPIDMTVVTRLDPAGDGATRVTQHWSGDTGGFFKLAEPIVTRITRKQMQASLDTLKELLEAGQAEG
jgi:carbon monoxide dehydrogenase subunit G